MMRLKRFRNWLGYVYYACCAFRQQFGADSYPAEAADQGSSDAIDAALVDSGPTVAAKVSDSQSEVIGSLVASDPAPAERAQVETVTPIERVAATLTEKILKEPTGAEEEHVAPIPEPKKVFIPAPKVETVPQQVPQQLPQQRVSQTQVALLPAAISSPRTQTPPASSASVKPQGANGATESPSEGGKYEPGTVNDQTAQRLARLLVSEIKLYYKSKTDGESGSELINIYDMLKDPIDKSRQHYKRRMGEKAIKTMPDYFHGELVRSLCGGDPSRLGPNYQASVERN